VRSYGAYFNSFLGKIRKCCVFNVNVGTEDIFKPTIGNEISHEIIDDNEVRGGNFATLKHLVVNSTLLPP
jgi:hypothetical protein